MLRPAPALTPEQFLRSVAASRDTLRKREMKLLEMVSHLRVLTRDAPHAIVGGLAQMLWARKTHTDDLDAVVAIEHLDEAYQRVKTGADAEGWQLPSPPDPCREQDDVFSVCHLLYHGTVVDLLSFADAAFTAEIIGSALAVPELGGIRFVRPELLLVTHLLRPGTRGRLAAIELVIARREAGGFDLPVAQQWAHHLGLREKLQRTLRRADEMTLD